MKVLNPLLKKQLEKLRSRSLVPHAVEDWDDLQRLNELAAKVTDPGAEEGAEKWLDAPVYVRNVKINRLSLGAYLWVKHRIRVWFKRRALYGNLGLIYAMVHSHNPAHLKKLRDRKACKSALYHFMSNCGATYAELLHALDTMIEAGDAEDGEEDKEEFGPLIARLCAEYGHDIDYWTWGASIEQVTALNDQWMAREQAKANATKGKGHKGMSYIGTAAYETFWSARCKFRKKLEARKSAEQVGEDAA